MLVSPPPVGIAAPAAAPDAQHIATQVRFDRVKMLFALTPPPLVAGVLFAMAVTAMMAPTAPPLVTLTWFALKLVVAGLRAAASWLFRTTAQRRQVDTGRWLAWYCLLMALDAASWGGMTVVFLPHAQGIQSTVLLSGAVGVASVALFTTFSHFGASLTYLLSVLTPIMVDQLSLGRRDNLLTAAALLVYFSVLAFEAWRSEKRQIEMLELRYVNASIAEQRRQALVLAEHSNAAKTRFLAAVSHEMRTPLNGILGMAQLLRTQVADAQQAHQLEVMRRSAWHLQNVIADLLDLSRIEFGRLEVAREPFVLADAVREVTDLLGAVAADKGLAFHLRFVPPLPERVAGDASRVKQVLHNLLGNAIKFTAQGSVSLEVATAGELLQFTVTDTGQGVAPEEAERIFDAFAQAGAALARQGGTGLGLTISRQIARAMGGEVRYDPAPGGGSRFRFTVRAAAVPEAGAHGARAWEAEPLHLHGEVLVVDDSAVNSMVACGMLEHFGLAALTAENGEQALQQMRSRRFDAVLMDCQMPVVDGFEATRRWRREERAQHDSRRVPIIAVTANAVPGDRERCLAAGMDDYLAKPFDLNELGALLQRYLKE